MMTRLKPKRGEIWLLRFPFTDLSSSKVRPALIIATYEEDSIVLGIFSRVPHPTTFSRGSTSILLKEDLI